MTVRGGSEQERASGAPEELAEVGEALQAGGFQTVAQPGVGVVAAREGADRLEPARRADGVARRDDQEAPQELSRVDRAGEDQPAGVDQLFAPGPGLDQLDRPVVLNIFCKLPARPFFVRLRTPMCTPN